MIHKPLTRYGILDSGSLCSLFRQPGVYIPSADDYTKPNDIMRFIDNALACDQMYVLGRNPKTEAYIFAPSHNITTFQAHFAVREDCRDGSTVRKVAEAGKWIFEHTTCRSVVSYMRESNVAARSLRDELIYQATIDDFNSLWSDELGEVL